MPCWAIKLMLIIELKPMRHLLINRSTSTVEFLVGYSIIYYMEISSCAFIYSKMSESPMNKEIYFDDEDSKAETMVLQVVYPSSPSPSSTLSSLRRSTCSSSITSPREIGPAYFDGVSIPHEIWQSRLQD